MAPCPWLSVTRTNENSVSIRLHKTSFGDVSAINKSIYPSLISLIGSRQKSRYLACTSGYAVAFEHHGQIRMIRSTDPEDKWSTVLMDCEISSQTSRGLRSDQSRHPPPSLDWTLGDSDDFSDQIIHWTLSPISSVICYFAADLQGIDGVVRTLAYQAVLGKAHNLPVNALPHVLVVLETRSRFFNTETTKTDIKSRIVREMIKTKQFNSPEDASRVLAERFRDINITDVQRSASNAVRTAKINKRLRKLQEEVHWARRNARYLFSTQHLDAFSVKIVSNFCRKQGCFDFLRESRPFQFDEREFKSHIDEFLVLLPEQSWLWRIAVPLLSSACCLASYPPGSHRKLALTLTQQC
jgi:hypothetical protein